MKKFLIFLCAMLFTAFWTPAFSKLQLTENGLDLITTKSVNLSSPKEIIQYLSGMESEFEQFIKQKEGKKQNSEVFGIFLKNANSLRNSFLESVENYNNLNRYNLHIISNHFVNPNLNILYIKNDGFMSFGFDYKYIQKNYCPHLDSTWNTYIKYNIQEEKDRKNLLAHDGEDNYYKLYTNLNKKWVKKWSLFTFAHPDFSLNEQITNDIESMEYYAEKKFNVNSYLISLVAIGIGGIILLGLLIFSAIKFNLTTKLTSVLQDLRPILQSLTEKLKAFAKNTLDITIKKSEKIFAFLLKFIKVIIITFGIIIVTIGIYLIHESKSIPKCDSKFAEETVIQIFKDNDNVYLHHKERVNHINMSNFEPESYDKEIGKYTCSATLTMYAKPDEILFYIYPFKKIDYDVNYEIYKERGKNMAKAGWNLNFRTSK